MSDTTLPIRPRRRLPTAPALVLAAVVVAAAGFVGGVLVQKQAGGGGTPAPAAAASSPPRTAGRPFGRGAAPIVGQVKTVDGRRLYVTRGDGTTVEVRVKKGARVTRTTKRGVGAIHPGDTVVVIGHRGHKGTVRAATVAATASGAGAGGRNP